jgi:hypothetical protein
MLVPPNAADEGATALHREIKDHLAQFEAAQRTQRQTPNVGWVFVPVAVEGLTWHYCPPARYTRAYGTRRQL